MSDAQRPDYHYRPMSAADVAATHALSVRLKWPHRQEDWAMLQRLSQGYVVEDEGKLIGSVVTCPQGEYATIGMVIVSDEYQGRGIGRRLMDLALDACGPSTAVLNATLAGAPLYASQGFIEFGQVHQHQGQVEVPECAAPAAGEQCRSLGEADRSRQLELANAGSGLDRQRVMDELFTITEHSVGIERDGQLRAFAILRPFGRGRSIGPVVAENAEQAQQLIATLLARVPGEYVRIDIPADSGLGAWLEKAGLKRVDQVAQMARGTPPQATGGVRQFALVTQAIG